MENGQKVKRIIPGMKSSQRLTKLSFQSLLRGLGTVSDIGLKWAQHLTGEECWKTRNMNFQWTCNGFISVYHVYHVYLNGSDWYHDSARWFFQVQITTSHVLPGQLSCSKAVHGFTSADSHRGSCDFSGKKVHNIWYIWYNIWYNIWLVYG